MVSQSSRHQSPAQCIMSVRTKMIFLTVFSLGEGGFFWRQKKEESGQDWIHGGKKRGEYYKGSYI
jgi:hypothetical protein